VVTKSTEPPQDQEQLHLVNIEDSMAHYAFLDQNNIVVDIIVGKDEDSTDWEEHYGQLRGQTCKRTSYNTYGNQHLAGGVPFRKNYAGIGYRYDAVLDAFIPPQTYPSWHLNTETGLWDPPTPMPTGPGFYRWDEDTVSWVERL